MNTDGRYAEQTSTLPDQIAERGRSSSELMLAEVRSYQESPNAIIGRRRETNFLEFSNPFAAAVGNDQNSHSSRENDTVLPRRGLDNYAREMRADGVTVFRDRVGLKVQTAGDVSADFRDRMLAQIQLLPEADRRRLAAAGVRIVIAGLVTDVEPSIADEQPHNWPDGTTQEDADGIYLGDRREVVVAERTRNGPNNRPEGVLRHEVGHALNRALGNVSESREFVQAYEQDVARMDSARNRRMSFWSHGEVTGRDETFADVYAALRGGVPNPEETRLIRQAFPRVAEVLRRRLGR